MLKGTFTILYSNYIFSIYLITSHLYRGAEVQCVFKKLKLI